MATRYYTEEAYKQIKQTIQEIDENDVSGITDVFSDLWNKIQQFIGFLEMDDYQTDMQAWYRKVLDSHNTTGGKVDRIFNAVTEVDTEYANAFDDQHTRICEFRKAVNNLRDVVSGNVSLADAQAAASASIARGTAGLQDIAREIITIKEQQALGKASKDLFGDAIKFGSNCLGYLGAIVKGDLTKSSVYLKKISDTFVATLKDVTAMATIVAVPIAAVVASKTGMSYNDFLNWEFDNVLKAEKSAGINSITDLLQSISTDLDEDLADCGEGSIGYKALRWASETSHKVVKISEDVDTAIDVYDTVDTLTDWWDTAEEWSIGKTSEIKEAQSQILWDFGFRT